MRAMLGFGIPWRRTAWLVVVVQLIGGLAASAVVYHLARTDEVARRQADLAQAAVQAGHHVEVALYGARAALGALAALEAATPGADEARLDAFMAELAHSVQGVAAQGVAALGVAVLDGTRPEAAGRAVLRVAAPPAAGTGAGTGAGKGTGAAVAALAGLDLSARADHAAAMAKARATGEEVLTGRLDLAGASGVVMLRAVELPGGNGWRFLAAAIRLDDVLAGFGGSLGGQLRMRLLDRSALPGEEWLRGEGAVPREGEGALHDIYLGGRLWTVLAEHSGPGAGLAPSLLLLALGLLATAGLTGMTIGIFHWRARMAVEALWRRRDLRLTARKLAESQRRFEDFLAAASDWYWETDSAYRFTFQSERARARAAGAPVLVGLDRMTDDDPEMEVAPRRLMLDRHAPFTDLRCVLNAETGQEAVSLTGRPVFDPQGRFVGYRGSARDTTAAAKAEAAERSARVAAEAANRSKSVFLANMSHEIRTPMNGMIGMAQILRHSGLDTRQRRSVDLILRSANTLLTVLNDILDYSKLEAGSIQLEAIPCSLPEVLEEVAALLRQSAEEKGVALLCDMSGVLPPQVMGDPVRLRQIMMNLATNAVKFTSQGSVRMTLTCAMAPPGPLDGGHARRVEVRMAVVDTGIGMDEATRARLFTRFMQADASSTRRFGGSGLGLSIAQGLARMMGGTVAVQSRLGEGSTFTLALSMAVAPELAAAGPEAADEAAGLEGEAVVLSILAAEDDEINRLVLSGFIEPYGHTLTLVPDGAEAVAAARAGRFDVILMDVMMPGMDGLEATRQIRALPPPQCGTPIIALTANAMAGHREQYLAAGMDDYVSKPISRAALYRAIEGRVGARAFVASAVAPPPAPSPAPILAPAPPAAPDGLAALAAFMDTLPAGIMLARVDS